MVKIFKSLGEAILCREFQYKKKDIYPHAFLKKRQGYFNRLPPSACPSVTLSPPKPLDEIQPNLVCGLLT